MDNNVTMRWRGELWGATTMNPLPVRRLGKAENRFCYACVRWVRFGWDVKKRTMLLLFRKERGTPISFNTATAKKWAKKNPVFTSCFFYEWEREMHTGVGVNLTSRSLDWLPSHMSFVEVVWLDWRQLKHHGVCVVKQSPVNYWRQKGNRFTFAQH